MDESIIPKSGNASARVWQRPLGQETWPRGREGSLLLRVLPLGAAVHVHEHPGQVWGPSGGHPHIMPGGEVLG